MSKELHAERIKNALKELIRRKGYRYEDAARALKVSLPTMRRWMSQGDFTLSQLSDFANWLDLDFFELLDLTRAGTARNVQFTDAQEKFFSANPKAISFFRLLAKGCTPAEIQSKFGLSDAQVQRHLLGLEKHDLIVIHEHRAKVKTIGPYKWKKGGPLEKAYLNKIVRVIADHVFQKASISTSEQIDGFDILFRPFELLLRPKTQKQFFKEMNELIDKYNSLSKIEFAVDGFPTVREVTGVLLGDAFSCWDSVLGESL